MPHPGICAWGEVMEVSACSQKTTCGGTSDLLHQSLGLSNHCLPQVMVRHSLQAQQILGFTSEFESNSILVPPASEENSMGESVRKSVRKDVGKSVRNNVALRASSDAMFSSGSQRLGLKIPFHPIPSLPPLALQRLSFGSSTSMVLQQACSGAVRGVACVQGNSTTIATARCV